MISGARVLAVPAYRSLFLGQTISQIGDALYYLVIFFMARQASGGADWAVGLVGAAQTLPYLLMAPLAGRIADRCDRRLVMLFSDLSSMGLTLALALVAWLQPVPSVWLLGLIGFLLSSVNAFFAPARTAAIPRLVPQEMLMEANALAMTVQQLAGMLGVALSATVLGVIYSFMPGAFLLTAALLNSITFLVSAYFLSRLPSLAPMEGESLSETNFREDFRQGWSAIRQDRFMRVALLLNLVTTLFISGFFVIYLNVNDKWFGNDFGKLAWIELSFMVFMAATSIYVGRLSINRIGLSIGWSTFGLGVLVALMATSQNYWLFLLWNALCGLFVPFYALPLITYIQTAFPDSMRGRVSSVQSMVSLGTQPLGLALVGPMLQWLGPVGVFLVMGFGLIAAALGGLANRSFRHAEMPPPPSRIEA